MPRPRHVLCLGAIALCACSKDPTCETEAAAIEIEVTTRSVELAARAHSIVVNTKIGEQSFDEVAQLAQDFLDGKHLVAVRLDPAPSSPTSAEITVTAFEMPSGRGELLGTRSEKVELGGEECRRMTLEVAPAIAPPNDGGIVDPKDAEPGQDVPTPDVPAADAGLLCGNGLIEQNEACDDNDLENLDGCSDTCTIEAGWTCSGEPSACTLMMTGEPAFRRPILIETTTAAPVNGWIGYTLRVTGIDTLGMLEAGQIRPDCNDLRVAHVGNNGIADLPRHLIGCGTRQTEIRFRAVEELVDENLPKYYLYYGNPQSSPPAVVGTNNVYLWYDDATSDRRSSYFSGRFDDFLEQWDARGMGWDPARFYTYDTLNDFVAGYRPLNIDERDVYIEIELYHEACYTSNMTSGVFVRYTTTATIPALESSNHYYMMARGYQERCEGAPAPRYPGDGDIVKNSRSNVIGADQPDRPPVPIMRWRKMALAAWGRGPTLFKAWDSDEPWSISGWPELMHTAGASDANSIGGGAPGFVVGQDAGRVRNILVRRFFDPEPRLLLGDEERLR